METFEYKFVTVTFSSLDDSEISVVDYGAKEDGDGRLYLIEIPATSEGALVLMDVERPAELSVICELYEGDRGHVELHKVEDGEQGECLYDKPLSDNMFKFKTKGSSYALSILNENDEGDDELTRIRLELQFNKITQQALLT